VSGARTLPAKSPPLKRFSQRVATRSGRGRPASFEASLREAPQDEGFPWCREACECFGRRPGPAPCVLRDSRFAASSGWGLFL